MEPNESGRTTTTGDENPLRFESQRLETFARWSPSAKVGAGKIARAGFYYTGNYSEVKCIWCGCTLTTWEYGDQVMGRHRRSNPSCPFVLNVSNNVPLASSPQPPPTPQVTPQTSQVDVCLTTADVTDTPNNVSKAETSNPPSEELPAAQVLPTSTSSSVPSGSTPSVSVGREEDQNRSEDEGRNLNQFFCEEKRLRTFRGWPLDFIHSVDLAKAGFIYSGINDCVRCVFCLSYAGSWEESDRPDTVHSELFPQCPFVRGNECGNKPMTPERGQEVYREIMSSTVEPISIDDNQMESVGGANDVSFVEAAESLDETGFRVRGRDLHSGPEKGHGVLTLKDPSKEGEVEELMGVIRHSGPAHAKYATLEARLRTFRDWPPALSQQPKELAESGFYYIGLSDQVKCFYCDGGLRNWQCDDDPWVEHSRWFSKCGFIRLVKGDEFIAECLVSKPPEAMPEIPPSSEDRFKMTEESLQAMMTSIEVQEALSSGIDPSRIRMVFRKKWEETGSGFSGSEHLIEALFRSGEFGNSRDNLAPSQASPSSSSSQAATSALFASINPSPQPNVIASPTQAVISSSGTSQAEPPMNNDTNEQQLLEPPVGTSGSDELRSPSIPDKGCQAEQSADKEHVISSKDLESENRRLKEERTCKICMDHEIGVVFLPCGHLICCFQCAPALTNCPLCRQNIQGTVKTYMS